MPSSSSSSSPASAASGGADTAFAAVGMFEAELIDTNISKVERKMVKLGTPAAEGASLPEQGSWHFNRRREILKAHPEVRSLYGTNAWTALVILSIVAFHTAVAIWMTDMPWWVIVLSLHTIGALNSFECQMLGHEAAHGLIFANRSPLNKVFCIISFLPTFLGAFAGYWLIEHMYHHNVVVDKCLRFGKPNNPVFRKLVICIIVVPVVQVGFTITSALLLVYSLVHCVQFLLHQRATPLPTTFGLPPFKSFPQIINWWTIANILSNIAYYSTLYAYYGWMPVFYLLLATCVSNGLHPLGMRMVQEHYVYKKGQPTASVYSPYSALCINVGYHVEHHDFPQIPWNRLPQVRATAPEFYNSLFHYTSYTSIFKEFFTNPGIPLSLMFSENPLTTH